MLDITLDHGKVILAFLALLGFNVACAIIAASLIAYKVTTEVDHWKLACVSEFPFVWEMSTIDLNRLL